MSLKHGDMATGWVGLTGNTEVEKVRIELCPKED